MSGATAGLLAIIAAYLAGHWTGATDGWWPVVGATVIMCAATVTMLRSRDR